MNGEIIEMLPGQAGYLSADSLLWNMYQWGIEVIKIIQRIENPPLTALVKFFTSLGTEAFYIPVVLFIFWWIDEKHGLRLGLLIIFSAWINLVLKDLLKQPRPYNIEAALGMAFEPTYGAPSGHAQMSLTFWIPLAAWLGGIYKKRRTLIWILSAAIILLIAFTRLYLGVHFPTDLFAGWIVGAVFLLLVFVLVRVLEKFFLSAGIRFQNICAAFLALLMNGVYPKDRTLPALFLGFFLGYNLMKQRFPFCTGGKLKGRKSDVFVMFLRCLAGFLGLAIIYMGLRFIFPGEGSLFRDLPIWGESSPFYELGRFVRYGLVGFWVSAGAPRLFQRMGLAGNSANSGGEEI